MEEEKDAEVPSLVLDGAVALRVVVVRITRVSRRALFLVVVVVVRLLRRVLARKIVFLVDEEDGSLELGEEEALSTLIRAVRAARTVVNTSFILVSRSRRDARSDSLGVSAVSRASVPI